MNSLTSRERIAAALNHREPDRTPYFEYVLLSPVADQILGRPYVADDSHWNAAVSELGWEEAVRRNALDRLDLARILGQDMLYAWPVPPPPPITANPASPDAPDDPPTSDDPVERLARRNAIAKRSPFEPSEDGMRLYAVLKSEMERQGLDLPILAPAYAHGVWTDTDLMQTMALAPEVAHEHFEIATKRTFALIDRLVGLGIDLIGVGGDFAGNRPILSPAMYRSFLMPEVRKLSRRVHASGRRAVNASDGDLWSVIDDFLLGCEVDGYLEIDLHAGMDLRRLKAGYGKKIVFFGNLDCGSLLSFGTEEEIRAAVLDCLEAGAGSGGHVLCASNAITGSVSLRNYLTVVETYRERFGLPRLAL